jgi:hypothetical protein
MMEKARSRPRIGRNNPEILQPRPAESCEAKAAQLVIDWLLDDLNPKKPWDCLASWLSTIGNPSLAAKLMRADSANFLRRCPWVGEANKTQSVFPYAPEKIPATKEPPISRSLMRILAAPAKRTSAVKAKK